MTKHVMRLLGVAATLWSCGTAVAQDTDSQLDEVIVTAERRAANLQTTPIAVSALGADDLARLQVSSIADLDTSVPSLTVETNVGSNAAVTIAMRGNAEQNAAFLFSEPGVGLYLNGVYRRLSGSNIELVDIERIEVLRGPQGTLFGRNTLAGAINIVSRAPSDSFDGSIQLGYGSYDTSRARLAVSGPISDRWAGSFSVLRQERGTGWATNKVNGKKVGESEFLGAMGSLAYEGDTVSALISVYSSDATNDGAWSAPVSVTTGRLVFSDPSDVAGASVRVGGATIDPSNDTNQEGADAVLTFKLGEWTLKSTTAYAKQSDDWAVDFTAGQFAAPAPFAGSSGFFRVSLGSQDQISQEFNLTHTGERLDTILGAFWYDEESDQLIQDYFAGGLFPGVPGRYRLQSKSIAVYTQLNYRLDDRWTLVGGGRYNSDDKTLSGRAASSAFAPLDFGKSRSFSRFSGKLGVEFEADDNLFTYLTFSQGYKAGTYDPFASAEIIASGLDEETVDSLELGMKAEFLNRTLRLNSALYSVRYKNLAIGTITPTGIVLKNAGETEVKGLESELTWLVSDRLRIFGSAALMDAKWSKLVASALATGVKASDAPPFTYDFQGSISLAYDVPVGSGVLSLVGTARHIDDYYQQVAHQNNPLDRVNARDFVDASATFTSTDGRHRWALLGKNLSNEQGSYSALNFSTFLFNNTAAWYPGEPRTWELNYTYSFK